MNDHRTRWLLGGVALVLLAATLVVLFATGGGKDSSPTTTQVTGEPGEKRVFTIPTASMEPTIPAGAQVEAVTLSNVDKLRLQRGEVVIVQPSDLWKGRGVTDTFSVRRIIGLPGETLTFFQGRVFIGRDLLDEPYTHGLNTSAPNSDVDPDGDGTIVVPPGEVFLLGDNRGASLDSRALGTLPIDDVVARVL